MFATNVFVCLFVYSSLGALGHNPPRFSSPLAGLVELFAAVAEGRKSLLHRDDYPVASRRIPSFSFCPGLSGHQHAESRTPGAQILWRVVARKAGRGALEQPTRPLFCNQQVRCFWDRVGSRGEQRGKRGRGGLGRLGRLGSGECALPLPEAVVLPYPEGAPKRVWARRCKRARGLTRPTTRTGRAPRRSAPLLGCRAPSLFPGALTAFPLLNDFGSGHRTSGGGQARQPPFPPGLRLPNPSSSRLRLQCRALDPDGGALDGTAWSGHFTWPGSPPPGRKTAALHWFLEENPSPSRCRLVASPARAAEQRARTELGRLEIEKDFW